jgi:hypothetical protein
LPWYCWGSQQLILLWNPPSWLATWWAPPENYFLGRIGKLLCFRDSKFLHLRVKRKKHNRSYNNWPNNCTMMRKMCTVFLQGYETFDLHYTTCVGNWMNSIRK